MEDFSASGLSKSAPGVHTNDVMLPVTDASNRADSPERIEIEGGENVITGVSLIVTTLSFEGTVAKKEQPGILVDKVQKILSPSANRPVVKTGELFPVP